MEMSMGESSSFGVCQMGQEGAQENVILIIFITLFGQWIEKNGVTECLHLCPCLGKTSWSDGSGSHFAHQAKPFLSSIEILKVFTNIQ